MCIYNKARPTFLIFILFCICNNYISVFLIIRNFLGYIINIVFSLVKDTFIIVNSSQIYVRKYPFLLALK